jgi:hypothetical protein
MSPLPSQRPPARRRRVAQLALAPLLGLGAALLVACGSSSNSKLIPLANAGPLQADFQEVAEKAETGNGNCSDTEKALLKTEQDFAALPASTDNGLRERLREGITNLHQRALSACQQPQGQTTGTTATTPTQSQTTPTTPTTPTQTTPPSTSTTPPQTTPAPETGGVAPEAEREERERERERALPPGGGTGPGDGNGNGNGNGNGGLEGGR